MRYGAKDDFRRVHNKKKNNKKDKHQHRTKPFLSLGESSLAYQGIVNSDKDMVRFALKQPYTSIKVEAREKVLAKYYTDILKLIIYKLTSEKGHLNKEFKINLANDVKILEISLDHVDKNEDTTNPKELILGPLKKDNPIFHEIIKKKLSDTNCLKLFELLYNSKNRYVKELRYLKNKEGLTPLAYAIAMYPETIEDSKAQRNLEKIIQKLLDQPSRLWSHASKTGDNELHITIIAHSYAKSKIQKTFLEKVARQLCSVYSDLERVKNLVNGMNKRNETPLHTAIRLVNPTMFNILVEWTDLTKRDTTGFSPSDLAKDMYHNENIDPKAHRSLCGMINILKKHLTKSYSELNLCTKYEKLI